MSGLTAPPLQPRWLDAAGRRLRYVRQGEGGDAVVMVHGFGARLESWSANQDALADGRTAIALDLPGHGESSLDAGSCSPTACRSVCAR